ncbi:hypothetical protein Q1695_003976 [Nippostrongylus brasiliensis]|nr:hypothetical protein Q1695_003976 [Nippostrongylus brasiliensis]
MTGPDSSAIAGFVCENITVILPKCKNPEAIYSLKKKRCECKVNGSDIKEREPEKFKNLAYMAAFVKRMFHYVRDSYVSVVQFSSYSRVTLPMRLYTNEQLQATPLVQRTGYTNIIAALIDADQQLQWRKENTQLVFVPIGFSGKSLAATFGSQKPHITRPAVNFNALTEMFFATLMQHMCVASTRK